MSPKRNRMNLKLISIGLIFSILIQVMLPLKSKGATLGEVNMKTTATSLKKGQTVELEIYLTGNSFAYFEAYMEYDTTVFETVNQATDIKVNPKLTAWNVGYSAGDTEFFSVSRSSGDVTCDGLLATITLKVLKDTDSSVFKLNDIYINNDSYEDETIVQVEYTLPEAAKEFYIKYNANTSDTVTGMPSSGVKIAGSDYTIAAGPTRVGYEFKGWNTVSNGTGTSYAAGSRYSTDADLDLYAQWEIKKSTLVVNPNGGVWEGSSGSQTFTQGYGTIKTIDAPTTNPNGNLIKFNGNGGISTKLQETQTTTFSGWTGATLNGTTYTFGFNNETLKANYTGNSVELPSATKTGATFKGWYDSATGGNLIGKAGYSYTPAYTTPSAIITLFAQYEEDTYTLTINPNGGKYNGTTSNSTMQGAYQEQKTVTAPTAPNGYTVTLNNDGTTTPLVQTKSFKQWKVMSGDGTISGTTYTFGTQNGEIKAEYEANSVTLPTPTKTGYAFDGWYTQATGGTKVTTPYTPTSDITLYAHWTANTYTITFDPGNNGTVSPTTKQVTYGQSYGTLPTPTRPGYTFKNWKDENNQIVTASSILNIAKNSTLTAEWEGTTYTLSIDPNGGTYNGSTNVSTETGTYQEEKTISTPLGPDGYTVTLDKNDGTLAQTSVVQKTTFKDWTVTGKGSVSGNKFTFADENGKITANYTANSVELETPTRTGYTFDGWYTTATDGEKITSPYTPTNNITLYAHWRANTYTITFNPGKNGTVNPTTKQVKYGQPFGTLSTPTRPGFDFDGWEDTNGNSVTENDIVKITQDTTLNAKWLGAEYTVTFDPNGGQVNPTSKKVRNEGKYGKLPVPTKTGYTFKGWYNINEQKIESTTKVNLTSDETVKAKWEANKYTITFNPGEAGAVDEPSREVHYGDTYGTLPTPTRPGYTFDGWYGPDGNKVESTDVIDTLTDITVTAKWTGKEYTLTFDYDGGNGDITSKTVKNGESYGELPTVTKTGHTFKGWFDENDNEITSTDIVNVTSNPTLKAKYEVNKYKVTFKNDDGTIINTIDVEYGKNAEYTGNIPEKSNVQAGYEATFNGWQDASKLINITEDVTVTATYTIAPKVYTITYNNLQDSDNSANPTTYTIEDQNITLVDLPNQGKYIFKGWYTSNDETGTKVTSIDTSKLGNIVLYAQWENDSLYFRSKKYKVGENDIDNYEDGDIYLDKIEPKTTLAELIDNCDTNGKITVINEKGQKLSSGDLVGTTMTIKVTRNDEEITLTTVVMGDISGDGKATTQDLSELNKACLGISEVELTGARFKAADIDDNGEITATDLSELNRASLGISKLVYKKPNK